MPQLPDESDRLAAGPAAAHSFSESEARLAYLLMLGDALRPLADPVEIQNAAMQVLGRQLGVTLAQYYEADESGRYLRSHGGYADGRRAVLERIRMDDFGLYLGENLRAGRTLAVADVSADPRVSREQLKSYDAFGFRAYVGIPLVKDGRLVAALGMHQSTRRDWTTTDLAIASETAERTWAAVERARAEAALSEKQALLAAQKEAFQAEMDDAPLATSLGILVDALIRMAGDGRRCAFYMADEHSQSLSHVVGMPQDYAQAVDGFAISPESLSCGLAVASGEPVVTPDVLQDERWQPWTWLARQHGYRACWSFPLETTSGKLVGSLAIYFEEPRDAQPSDHELAAAVTKTAAIIISRHQENAQRTHAEAVLRESEAKYRGLFESIDSGYCVIEVLFDDQGQPVDYVFLETNRAFVAHTGLADAIGQRVRDLAPTHEDFWFQTYGRIVRTGVPERFEHRADALNRWYTVYASRIGEPGQHRVAVLFEDIKERKLREQGAAFLDGLGQQLEPLSDPDEIMQVAGKRICAFFGVSGCVLCDVDEARNQVTVQHGWTAPSVPSLRQTFQLDDYLTDEFARANRAGENFIVRDTDADARTDASAYALLRIRAFVVVPFVSEGHWKASYAITSERAREWRPDEVALLKELSERLFLRVERARAGVALQAAFGAVQRSRDELREADAAKDRFLAVLSHELRNPLASIGAAAAVLAVAKADADRGRAGQVIARQTAVMKSLLDDLLDITRLNLGRIELRRQTLGLDEVVNAALENVRPMLRHTGHDLEVELPGRPPMVNGDPLRLVQVVANLLSNAIKYTPPPGRLRLAVGQDGMQAKVVVSDNGMGMQPDKVEQMFTMFNRGEDDGSSGPAPEGLGIGLALARSIAQLHGGTLKGRSEGRGRGSEFVFTLPLADPSEAHAPDGTGAAPAGAAPRGTVLLVDDNLDVIWAHGLSLKLAGWKVLEAATGREALALARQHRPIAAVLDIGLPDLNGREVARQLRGAEWGRHMVLIAATGWGQPADEQASAEAGFDMHLTKPVKADLLIQELERLTAAGGR